ncbi:hypothetical protein OAB57_02940, partial [Bacteriovoracaceae bacterium]|nr:hypothetical protein [Bacteriovoracaceae bacterium]
MVASILLLIITVVSILTGGLLYEYNKSDSEPKIVSEQKIEKKITSQTKPLKIEKKNRPSTTKPIERKSEVFESEIAERSEEENVEDDDPLTKETNVDSNEEYVYENSVLTSNITPYDSVQSNTQNRSPSSTTKQKTVSKNSEDKSDTNSDTNNSNADTSSSSSESANASGGEAEGNSTFENIVNEIVDSGSESSSLDSSGSSTQVSTPIFSSSSSSSSPSSSPATTTPVDISDTATVIESNADAMLESLQNMSSLISDDDGTGVIEVAYNSLVNTNTKSIATDGTSESPLLYLESIPSGRIIDVAGNDVLTGSFLGPNEVWYWVNTNQSNTELSAFSMKTFDGQNYSDISIDIKVKLPVLEIFKQADAFTKFERKSEHQIGLSWKKFKGTYFKKYLAKIYKDDKCTDDRDGSDKLLPQSELGRTQHDVTGLFETLPDGHYYARVIGTLPGVGNFVFNCSEKIVIDRVAPVDISANPQFVKNTDEDGKDITISWTAFQDIHLDDYEILLYETAQCNDGDVDAVSKGRKFGPIGTTNPVFTLVPTSGSESPLAEGVYKSRIHAIDKYGNKTLGTCSTDTIKIDYPPTVPSVAATFTTTITDGPDGSNNNLPAISLSWTAAVESDIANYRLYTYTDSNCTIGEATYALVAGGTTTDTATIDNLPVGEYWVRVLAIDGSGFTPTKSNVPCSTNSLIVDATAPGLAPQNVSFGSAVHNGTGLTVSWTAGSDHLSNHKIDIYTDSSCSTLVSSPLTGSGANSGSINITPDNQYWAKVTAIDGLNRSSAASQCSQVGSGTNKSVSIDTQVPDNTGAVV